MNTRGCCLCLRLPLLGPWLPPVGSRLERCLYCLYIPPYPCLVGLSRDSRRYFDSPSSVVELPLPICRCHSLLCWLIYRTYLVLVPLLVCWRHRPHTFTTHALPYPHPTPFPHTPYLFLVYSGNGRQAWLLLPCKTPTLDLVCWLKPGNIGFQFTPPVLGSYTVLIMVDHLLLQPDLWHYAGLLCLFYLFI